ncbi:MAG: hypothetical protein D6725_12130 [Planctomycetota bacterium]|nr:MAG: hypothetical protein D6725_12130 [Planctomycetota bacterium]
MKRTESLLVTAPMLLFLAVGCYTYYPYGYGMAGPYGMPPGAFSGAMPQGAYINPQDFGSTTVAPGAGPAMTAPQGSSTTQPQGSGTQTAPSQPQTFEKPVPSPNLLETPDRSSDAGFQPTAPSGSTSRVDPASDASPDEDPFQPPVAVQNVSKKESRTAPVDATGPSPYAHDPDGYSWLRGVLDFDRRDNRWRLRYSPDPTDGDPYGGDVALELSQDMSGFEPGDVVLVEGGFDTNCRDRFGKPCYRVQRLIGPLVPEDK